MIDPTITLSIALSLLATTAIVALAGLKAWHGWLDLRRAELDRRASPRGDAGSRIDLSDLRERVRKLEAIAAGVDL